MKGLERILELQELDLSVDRLLARRAALESGEELGLARERMNKAEDTVGELRMALDSVVREQSRVEGDIASIDQKIAAEERRLYDGSVVNPKELEAIQAELGSLRQRKGRMEDEDLIQMERREEMEKELPARESELEEARRRFSEIGASAQAELAEIEVSLGDRRESRERLVPELDGELLDLYEDLRAHKKGIGAAALEDGVCQGCNQRLSPLELDRIKRTEGLRRCEYCRRILLLR